MSILPYEEEEDPFAYTEFIGNAENPYVGEKGSVADMLLTALVSPLTFFDDLSEEIKAAIANDKEGLPFSYCRAGIEDEDSSCYETPQELPENYLSVFFPLRKGETERKGKWLMSIGGFESGFQVFYRDALSKKISALDVFYE